MSNNKEVGDVWEDDLGNKYEIKSIEGTVVVSESIGKVENEPED